MNITREQALARVEDNINQAKTMYDVKQYLSTYGFLCRAWEWSEVFDGMAGDVRERTVLVFGKSYQSVVDEVCDLLYPATASA